MNLTKTKKFLAMLLVAVLIIPCALLFTACGNANVAKVSTLDELKGALSGEKEIIKLEKDLALEETIYVSRKVTFDLNGKTLTAESYDGVFLVNVGGDLTIKGNGKVVAIGGFAEDDTKHESEYTTTVWARGGKVTIVDGEFSNQTVNGDDHYDLIYASTVTENEIEYNGEITILGGKFQNVTPKWTLNLHDKSTSSKIIVKGGTFVNYNPAESMTEPTSPVSFVAEGYKAELVEGSTTDYIVVKN